MARPYQTSLTDLLAISKSSHWFQPICVFNDLTLCNFKYYEFLPTLMYDYYCPFYNLQNTILTHSFQVLKSYAI